MSQNLTAKRISVVRRFIIAWLILFIPALALAYPLGLAPAGIEQVGDAVMARITGENNVSTAIASAAAGPLRSQYPALSSRAKALMRRSCCLLQPISHP